jgi:type VI secretion system protein ImpF
MASPLLNRRGFEPTLFDRLFDDAPGSPQETAVLRLTLEELKDSVAGDLEALLNSRCAADDALMEQFPQASRSIVRFGLPDFCGMTLASPADRNSVCRSLERAIAQHEPRLRDVRVRLEVDERQSNQLKFSIAALLVVNPAREVVSFDALLQPSTLQYSVSRGRRTAA